MTVSLCMIVKNEEKVLDRCLSSIADLCDEVVIVDTGSTDSTKSIAARYTDHVYEFKWIDDFSAARNYAFSKCTCDYIYSADADEYLDEENQTSFKNLLSVLDPAIEIVQMHYYEPGISDVLNSRSEYRPKLYKRLRTFRWVDPVHETVATDPLVFDSDIVITHAPEKLHTARDFGIFEKAYHRDGTLSRKLYAMYARELYKNGTIEEIRRGSDIFREVLSSGELDSDLLQMLLSVLAKDARLNKNAQGMLLYTSRLLAVSEPCSEVCFELGEFFYEQGEYQDASLWYLNAAQQQPLMDVHAGGDAALRGLGRSYAKLSEQTDGEQSDTYRDLAEEYENKADSWQLPEE